MPKTILIVDDEPDLVATLDYNLQREGYRTRLAHRGAEALEEIARAPAPDLVLLDLMLPDMSGKEVCRALRARDSTSATPVIMLTARGEEIDRVVGFEVGADDYVVKPFSVRELMLRVRAILRRSEPVASSAAVATVGRLRVDAEGHRLWVDDDPIQVTSLEFRLLKLLLDRRGRVQTRGMLLNDVWEMDADLTTRTVDTHVKRLRQKLGPAATYIETVRGVGYRFADRIDENDA